MKRQGHCSLRKGPVVWGFRVVVREGKDDRGAAIGQSVPTPKFIRLSLFAVTSGAPISCFPLTLHSQPSFLSCLVTSRPVSISRCISVSEFSRKKPESLHHVRSLSGPLRMSILPSFWPPHSVCLPPLKRIIRYQQYATCCVVYTLTHTWILTLENLSFRRENKAETQTTSIKRRNDR